MVTNSLGSERTVFRNMNEINRWDNRPFSGMWPGSNREKPTDIKRTIKKKPKRVRTAYTTDQIKALEIIFTQNKYITSERRREISKALNIAEKCVKIWFQNRRMKVKRESSESSSDSSTEASVCEMSPSLPLAETQNSEQLSSNINQDSMQLYSTETCQYQVPNFNINYQNTEQIQLAAVTDNAPMNNMQLFYDNHIYPTQYYPPNDVGNFSENNYYHYQQGNTIHSNYSNCTNNVMSGYFYYN